MDEGDAVLGKHKSNLLGFVRYRLLWRDSDRDRLTHEGYLQLIDRRHQHFAVPVHLVSAVEDIQK